MGKDDVVEAAFKQSHIVEKKALESSKNSGDVCAFCHERGMSKPWAVNVSCDMHGCGNCKSIFSQVRVRVLQSATGKSLIGRRGVAVELGKTSGYDSCLLL